MKIAVVFLAIAVYGTRSLSIPTLSLVNSTAHKVINKTHNVNGQIIDVVDSTNQAVANYVKDGSQKGTLMAQDAMDKMGDKTKEALQLGQDKTNQLLGIFGQFGGPFKWGAAIGSKVTNLTADVGKTMTNVGTGMGQMGTAAANQMFGATVDKMAGVSSAVSDKVTAANDLAADMAFKGVDEAVKVTSAIGKGVGNAIEALGEGVSNWFMVSSKTENTAQVPRATVNATADIDITD